MTTADAATPADAGHDDAGHDDAGHDDAGHDDAVHDEAVLDDPVGESLRGRHAHLAESRGRVLRYRPDVASFVAVPPRPSDDDWSDAAALLGPGGFLDLFHVPVQAPEGWAEAFRLEGVQMVRRTSREVEPDPRVERLGDADVPDMLALVERTRPGPFWPRTIEMGRYVGIRRDGVLVAMAGERLHPPGWTEISAVCTAPEARGLGLAATLVSHAAALVEADGDRPFLHTGADNTTARALYERLGFVVRRELAFHGSTVPDGPA